MFLIDNNLSPKIADKIKDSFSGCKHVFSLALDQASDEEVFKYAKSNHYAILTKDADFYHLLNKYGYPPKIVWIRSGNFTTEYIISLLINNDIAIQNFLTSPAAGILELY